MSGWQETVHGFWFEELTPDDWFKTNEATDKAINKRFKALHERLRDDLPKEAMIDPRAALAAVIVFDQFPRNMYRRQAAAFSTDAHAMRVAKNALDKGFDDGMTKHEKQFLFMPFMHSEVLADQERGVMLFKALGDEDVVKYAIDHRDIIARFGRFPHRNRALGRTSTLEEQAFLEGHEGYGQ